MGYLWRLAYEEIMCNMHLKGTYCEIIKCSVCEVEFYFNDADIPFGKEYEVQCPNCKAAFVRKK